MTDIKLCVGNIDVQRGEATQRGHQLAAAGRRADDKVALEADTVDGCTCSLDDVDNFHGSVGLRSVVFKVVVVVVAGGFKISI